MRHCLDVVHHQHPHQRACSHWLHHDHGRGHREFHSGDQFCPRADGGERRRCPRCRPARWVYAFSPGAHDRSGHDHRDGSDVLGTGRRRRTECSPRPGGHRWVAVRDHSHPVLRAHILQRDSWMAGEASQAGRSKLARSGRLEMRESEEMDQERRVEQPQPANAAPGGPPHPPPLSGRIALLLIVVLLLVAVVIVVAGIVPRVRARTTLADQTDALAAPTVIATPPTPGTTGQELILPANIYAYSDAPLYARTDGYLSKWYFDIGAHVRQGQLLAIISSPEVDKQLLQARADLNTAEANAGLAKTNAGRAKGFLTQNAVSKQDPDTFTSQAQSTSSAVKSAQANVQRLEELQAFEKIYAPFSGVITARGVDVGQLINSGAGTLMFRISAINVLRVYVNVPQIYSQTTVPGTTATLTFSEFPGQTFTGKVVRSARAIDPSSRTLLIEIDVQNQNGKLMPGAYAEG